MPDVEGGQVIRRARAAQNRKLISELLRVCVLVAEDRSSGPGSATRSEWSSMMWASTWVDDLRVTVLQHHMQSPNRITEERAGRVLEFIELLPAAMLTQPRLVLALDGEIALMWETDDRCLVIVPEDGQLRYVAQFGNEEKKGTVAYSVGVPSPVREILTQGFSRLDA